MDKSIGLMKYHHILQSEYLLVYGIPARVLLQRNVFAKKCHYLRIFRQNVRFHKKHY